MVLSNLVALQSLMGDGHDHDYSTYSSRRSLVDGEVSEDILPAWFAFAIGGVVLSVLLVNGIYRVSTGTDMISGWLTGASAEFLALIGANATLMGFLQVGAIQEVKFIILGIVVFVLLLDTYHLVMFSKEHCDPELIRRSFPRLIFSQRFRDSVAAAMLDGGEVFAADDQLIDLASSYKRTVLLALGQLLLLSMYVSGLILRGTPPFEEQRVYVFYWSGIFVQAFYTAGRNKFLGPFDGYIDWVNVFRGARKNMLCVKLHEDRDPHISKFSKRLLSRSTNKLRTPQGGFQMELKFNDPRLWMRFFLFLVIQHMGLVIIMLVLPVQLAWADEPTEFVLDAIAVFFIVELDHLFYPVEYKLIPKEDTQLTASTTTTSMAPNSSTITTTTS